ncbi:hypothetical protein BLOT_012184 [Blomia tropicalis]|nr:hypothetical protein BLOT_012184 [Blomia tropicalis]
MISPTVNGMLKMVIIRSEIANTPINTLVELARRRRCAINVRHTNRFPHNDTITINVNNDRIIIFCHPRSIVLCVISTLN